MRKAFLIILTTGLWTWPAAAVAKCPSKQDARILASNSDAIIVETRRRDASQDGQRRAVWACLRNERRWQRITTTSSGDFYVDRVSQLQLSSTKLAYVWERGNPRQEIITGIRVHDLRARRRTTDFTAGYEGDIPRLWLARTGAVAFSVLEYDFEGDPVRPRAHRRIYTARSSQVNVIDDSLEIRLNSLRRSGSRLTWLDGTEIRRARLL